MLRYTVVRLFWAFVTLIAVMFLVFILTRVIGNPVNVLLPLEASPQQRQLLSHQLGLDQPVWKQTADFFSHALRGDFGKSWQQDTSALGIALERLPYTLKLCALAFLISVLIGVPLGVISALVAGTWADRLLSSLSLLGVCLPNFWLGLMLMILFGVKLHWLPTSGSEGFKALIMPAFSLALMPIGRITLIVRSAMVEEMAQQYVLTARAKGLIETLVVIRHALRNAAIALVTISGWELARMLAGYTVAVEVVFAYPGIGHLIVDSIQGQDFPLVQAITLVVAIAISLINLLTDVSYALIDARVRFD